MFAVLVLVILTLAQPVEAAKYYVDFVSGQDTSDGLTQLTPWLRFPGMRNETVATSLVAGDIVCLKGGVTWPDRVTAVSGVSYYSVGGSPTAAAACAGWGEGKAIIDAPAASAFGAFHITGPSNGVIVDGLHVKFREYGASHPYTTGGFYLEGTAGNPITNTIIRYSKSTSSSNGVAVIRYVTGLVIEDSDFSDNPGPTLRPICIGSGILLSSAGGVTTVTDVLVQRVTSTNNGKLCFDTTTGWNEGKGVYVVGPGLNLVIRDSIFEDNGGNSLAGIPDGAQIDGGGWTNVVLSGNIFRGQTAAEIKAGANQWKVYGNLFQGSSAYAFQYGYFGGKDSVGAEIYNNTIITTHLTGSPVTLSSPGTTTKFRNNLLVCAPNSIAPSMTIGRLNGGWLQTTWDHSLSNNYTHGCATYIREVPSTGAPITRSLSEHRAAYPNQAQSSGHLLNETFPGVVDYTGSQCLVGQRMSQ